MLSAAASREPRELRADRVEGVSRHLAALRESEHPAVRLAHHAPVRRDELEVLPAVLQRVAAETAEHLRDVLVPAPRDCGTPGSVRMGAAHVNSAASASSWRTSASK